MYETTQDRLSLQKLIDESIDNAGVFLKGSFEMPAKSLSAEQLIAYFDKEITVSLATVSRGNAPRVAPIGAIFHRGHFCIPTTQASARSKMLENNSNISMTYYDGLDFAVILHGIGEAIPEEQADFVALDEHHQAIFGNSVTEWHGSGLYIRLIPHVLFTYARFIEQFK